MTRELFSRSEQVLMISWAETVGCLVITLIIQNQKKETTRIFQTLTGMSSPSKRDSLVEKVKPNKENQLRKRSLHQRKEVGEMTTRSKTWKHSKSLLGKRAA